MADGVKTLLGFLLRWVALASFAVWFGGFTFYSAVVIPVLHDELGGVGQGLVTGDVSNTLNLFGVFAVSTWWLMVGVERTAGERWARRSRAGLLAVSTVVLLGLMAIHPTLDALLDAGSMRRFHPLHKAYLFASTFQWGVNLLLLAATIRVWQVDHAKLQRAEGRVEMTPATGPA